MLVQPVAPRERIVSDLYQQAVALFGPERAETLRASLEQRAEQIRRVLAAAAECADEPPVFP